MSQQPLTQVEVENICEGYLNSLGWDLLHQVMVLGLQNSSAWNPTLAGYLTANINSVATMWAAGKAAWQSSATSFDPTTYAIPHPPSDFGL